MAVGMTEEEVLNLPVSVPLAVAGRAWGMGDNKSRDLARTGQFPCPVHRLGSAYVVVKADLLRSLGLTGADEIRESDEALST